MGSHCNSISCLQESYLNKMKYAVTGIIYAVDSLLPTLMSTCYAYMKSYRCVVSAQLLLEN